MSPTHPQPNGKYHRENVQEDFLVLSGECIAIIDGEERPLRAWDFLHCPVGTEHSREFTPTQLSWPPR